MRRVLAISLWMFCRENKSRCGTGRRLPPGGPDFGDFCPTRHARHPPRRQAKKPHGQGKRHQANMGQRTRGEPPNATRGVGGTHSTYSPSRPVIMTHDFGSLAARADRCSKRRPAPLGRHGPMDRALFGLGGCGRARGLVGELRANPQNAHSPFIQYDMRLGRFWGAPPPEFINVYTLSDPPAALSSAGLHGAPTPPSHILLQAQDRASPLPVKRSWKRAKLQTLTISITYLETERHGATPAGERPTARYTWYLIHICITCY
jgi:hypothetical protein